MGRPSDARQRLIGAAKEVIYATSYEAVTVDELYPAVGVNKSSFYHFFSSKREFVLVDLESQWHSFEQIMLKPSFSDHLCSGADHAFLRLDVSEAAVSKAE